MGRSWKSNRRLRWEPIHGACEEAVAETASDSSHATQAEEVAERPKRMKRWARG